MRKNIRNAVALCAAACALSATTVAFAAQPASLNPTKITKNAVKGQTATTKKIKVSAKTKKGAGTAIVKFTLPHDGYVIPIVSPTDSVRIDAAIAYPTSQRPSNLKAASANSSYGMSKSIGLGNAKSDPGTVKYTVYKDAACRKTANSVMKNAESEGLATAYEGAYMKKGTYYVKIVNTKKTAQTLYASVGYVQRRTNAVKLAANAWEVGTTQSKSAYSTYKISVPSKKNVSIGAFGGDRVEIRTTSGKVVAKANALFGEVFLHAKNHSLGIGMNAGSGYKYLTAKLAKGTYVIRVYGSEPHLVKWTMK